MLSLAFISAAGHWHYHENSDCQRVRTMKILLDDGLSTSVALTGIGHQCLGLYHHLRNFAEVTLADYHEIGWLPRQVRRAAYLFVSNVSCPLSSYDVVHYNNFYTPRLPSRGAKVVTIHDLWMFHRPDTLPRRYVPYIQRAVAHSLQRAELVIVPSVAIEQEILLFFPSTPPDKIIVLFNGLRDIFWRPPETAGEVVADLQDKSYFLHVGTIEERKNISFLVQCFQRARQRGDLKRDSRLVLVGRLGPGHEQIMPLIRACDFVHLLGHVSDEELLWLYHHAKALVFPSLYEGFGIPLIEAMSCKLPIIRSDITASIEIDRRNGSRMFGFPLDSSDKLCEMLCLLEREGEYIRASLDYGDLSIYHFDQVARQHLAAYQMAIERKAQFGSCSRPTCHHRTQDKGK